MGVTQFHTFYLQIAGAVEEIKEWFDMLLIAEFGVRLTLRIL